MEFEAAKEKFISAWGTLGSNWGINRTMAQVHALLMISDEPISAEEVMEELNISRGNANMNIRALINMGIVFKEHKAGERKEFFRAEKDVWQIARQIILDRRRKELEPMLRVLEEVKEVKESKSDSKVSEFKAMVNKLDKFSRKTDKALDKMIRADEHWFMGPFMKMMK